MLAGSLLMGFTVIAFAIWLEYNDGLGWPEENERAVKPTDHDERYHHLRRRWRRVVHALIATCGALMAAAGLAGLGPFWIACWTAVAILLLSVIMIAMGDAIRTQRYFRAKLHRHRQTGDE